MKITVFILFTLLVSVYSAQAITVNEVLDSMEANENAQSARMIMTMTVIDPSGRETVSELVSLSADKGDKSLMEYTAPARIKGMKILSLNDGDDIWFYSPRTARTRKIASNQKGQSVNNSDFSYEDMSSSDRRTDYDCKLLADTVINGLPHFTIDMKPKNSETSYSRIIFYVDKKTYMPLEGRFFDESGALWKRLFMKNVSKIGAYWTAESIEMQNVLKGSRTIMKTGKVEYDIPLDPELFSERTLKR